MTIKIGFSKPNTFKIGAWFIQKWTSRPYSHVYIVFVNSQNDTMVFHAAHGLVHTLLYSRFLDSNIVIKEYSLDFNDQEYSDFRKYYDEKLGLSYDFSDLVKIFTNDLGFDFNIGNNSGFICSELASDMLNKVKGIAFEKPFYLVKPGDIDDTLAKLPSVNPIKSNDLAK